MGGYLHLVQTHLAASLTATRMLVWNDGGTMAAAGMSGTSESGERVLVVTYERPAEFSMPTGKQAAEAVHVEKYRLDCKVRGAGDPFQVLRPVQNDPPDFLGLDRHGEPVGVECRALADETRRQALGLLAPLERRLRQLGHRAFQHLEGTVVYVYFHDADSGGLAIPRRSSDTAAYDELVDAIVSLPVNRSALWLDDHEPMPNAPDIGLVTTGHGDRAHAAPVNDNHRPSRLMRHLGFDLVLGYTTVHALASVHEQVRDVLTRKDKPGNDVLLLTAGGPNPQGLTFPAEEFVAGMLFDDPPHIDRPRHVRQVVLHRWGGGDAWELWPEHRPLMPAAQPHLPDGLSYAMPTLPPELAPHRNAPCPCGSGRKFKQCHGAATDLRTVNPGLLVPRWR